MAVSGNQANGGSPTFTGSYGALPSGVTVSTHGLTCSQLSPSTAISGSLASGDYTLLGASCGGVTLSGSNGDYVVSYTTAADDFTVTGGPVPVTPAPAPTYGYWLVGSDGGIFTFGSAQFYGSTGSIKLQRPVVGISPTANKAGYWLVASDGGIFAFGDAGYFGSIPGDGLAPAGSGRPHSLNAPIVAMVPSSDGGGYFMVASDGGVFAFGDARFAGSCPGIGGCSGAAVAVVPDASGNGYWLVTQTGNIYAFGDAPFYGAPGTRAPRLHQPCAPRTAGATGSSSPTVPLRLRRRGGPGRTRGLGGRPQPGLGHLRRRRRRRLLGRRRGRRRLLYGDAPDDGSMLGSHLNGSIIAASGF